MKIINRWLLRTSAKDIGIQYIFLALWSAMMGLSLSFLIRLEWSGVGQTFLSGNNQLYNVIITAHAIVMIFFFVMPTLLGGLGNFLIPLMIGSPD